MTGVDEPNRLNPIARTLRKRSTNTEARLWRYLRDKRIDGFKFRRQHPIGRYVVDFVCLEKRLIVEADGGQHNESEKKAKDRERDEWLRNEGYKVLRFWDNEVFENLEGVLERIRETLLIPLTLPSPPEGRGNKTTPNHGPFSLAPPGERVG
jgi:very-short-patch-repair endonuclease